MTLFLDINSEATDVKLGDMTGDGSHDILIADRGVWGFHILESSAGGDGAVEFERLSKEQPFFIGQLECGDYNRGDRLDILAAEHQAPRFLVYTEHRLDPRIR
ncbi:MAG: hypothetical protein ACE5F1_08405 [Planctomycetota bacterium]